MNDTGYRGFGCNRRLWLAILLLWGLFAATTVYGQGQFASKTSGLWSSPSSWQLVSGSSVTGVPEGTDSATIHAGHVITISGTSCTILQLQISGTLQFSSAVTLSTGSGGITINNGSDVTGSANGVLESTGGLAINASLSSNTVRIRLHTTTGQKITGTGSLPILTIIGTSVLNKGLLTVRTTLDGSGTFVNDTNAILRFKGNTIGVSSLDLDAPGNTVDYCGSATQSCRQVPYQNLAFSSTASVNATSNMTVNGDFFLLDSALFNVGSAKNYRFYGDVTLSSSVGQQFDRYPNNKWYFRTPSSPRPTTISGTYAGPVHFERIYVENTEGVSLALSLQVSRNIDIAEGVTLTPASEVLLSGPGTLNLSGTLRVTRDLSPGDGYASQFPLGSSNLANGTVEYVGLTTQTITPLVYNNLVASGPRTIDSILLLGGSVTVTGQLILSNGTVVTDTGTINVINSAPNAVVISPSGRIVGHINRIIAPATSSLYLLTDANTFLRPDGSQDSVVVLASAHRSIQPPAPWSNMLACSYDMTASGPLTADIRLSYEQCELNGLPALNLCIVRGPAGSRTILSSYSDTTARWVEASGVSSFSAFALADTLLALPITLSSFTGAEIAGGRGILLTWETVSEVNNYGFYIERRTGGVADYERVGDSFVSGNGTTMEPHTYSFVDNSVSPGEYYYRLVQVDLDGTMHASYAIMVSVVAGVPAEPIQPGTFMLYPAYPNPFNPSTVISFFLPASERMRIAVYDNLGREVKVLVDDFSPAGRHSVTLDASDLASGNYFCRASAGSQQQVQRLLLTK